MEAVKNKWFWGIFISILSIFAMSYNVSAIGTFNLDNYTVQNQFNTINFHECNYNGINNSNISICNPTNLSRVNITSLIPAANLQFKKNDVIQFDIFVDTEKVLDIREIVRLNRLQLNTANAAIQDITLINPAVPSLDVFTYENVNNNLESFNIISSARTFYIWRFEIKVLNDFTGVIGLKTSNNDIPIFTYYDQYDSNGNYGIFRFRCLNYRLYRFIGSEENREVEEKTQDAVDDSQAAGGDSSQDAQTGTTGLLNAITGAVSVISSASPTNCKINGNMGNLDMGQLDLCANPAPAFIQTIGSLILILMCVPLAISLFNRFIAIFRSFQS